MGQFGKVLNLRILFDTSILATATRDHGIGAYARRLARALGGHPVAGVEMVFLGYGRSGFRLCSSAHEALRPTTRFRRYHWSYHFRLELNRWARRARADLVHLPHTAASPLYGLRCPWVVTAHDLIPFRFSRHYPDWSSGGPWGRRWLDRRRYRRARRVVAVSDATAADVGRLCDISAARIDVVGHGLDAAWAAGPTQATWLRDYVFYVGDADPRKDLATLLQGLGESGTGWSLVWAGVTSPSRAARVRATAEQFEVTLHRLGWVGEAALRGLYRDARALALVSWAEGFGWPVLEAMAMGTPAIVRADTVPARVAGDAGWPVEGAAEIAGSLRRIRDDERERTRRIEVGRARAEAMDAHTWASRMGEVYARALA